MASQHGNAFVAAIDAQATRAADAVAFVNSRGERLTYGQLRSQSDALAAALYADESLDAGVPVVVYGHKSPYMLVSFLACLKSRHAYVPVDVTYPAGRVAQICKQLGGAHVLDTTVDGVEGGEACTRHLGLDQITQLASQPQPAPQGMLVDGEDAFYILFTSGSTGEPKGVIITSSCVDAFSTWLLDSFGAPGHHVNFNRAPFSFDQSFLDMVLCLAKGDTLFMLEEADEANLSDTFAALAASGLDRWHSTPTALEQCLADPAFNETLLPGLTCVICGGETLRPATARLMRERFPRASVYNVYGPTESTDIVTYCEITDDMLVDDSPLPVGYAMPNCDLHVLNPDTLEEVACGERGELFIVAETVAAGYWGRPDLTAAAFDSCPERFRIEGRRSYRTGDEVSLREDGMLDFYGRLDLQIKLHGYRIELGEVETHLSADPEVGTCCVVPVMRDGVPSSLVAFVVPSQADATRDFAQTKRIKERLRVGLSDYMVPRRFRYVDEIPLTSNGKADRKALAAEAQGR